MNNGQPHIEFRDVSAFYGAKQVLRNVSLSVPRHSVIGIIGPANSGKTTLLKIINRTLDFVGCARFEGQALVNGDKAELDAIVERCLKQSVLWDEVKDRLNMLGTRLSGGQQQRLTLARALSLSPEILCLDEFSIAIDPVTTMRIEEVLRELRQTITIVLVTNLVQQARRLADNVLFLWRGEVIEFSPTEVVFSEKPKDKRTYDYVNGIFG